MFPFKISKILFQKLKLISNIFHIFNKVKNIRGNMRNVSTDFSVKI